MWREGNEKVQLLYARNLSCYQLKVNCISIRCFMVTTQTHKIYSRYTKEKERNYSISLWEIIKLQRKRGKKGAKEL